MSSPVQNEKSIFLHAIELDSLPQRAEFLATACSGNPELRTAVERLLLAHENAPRMLRAPDDLAERRQPVSEGPGTIIGTYKLLQQIGEGGMGVVFLAEQTQPLRRKVAMKIIKPGMDSRRVIARFEAERQALAMMNHPSIARIMDAGVVGESGRPYFVMELVHGVAITDYCDQHRLGTRARLELFITVCLAVQHAHQKGVIHRDLKPSNILVELHDVTPVPKIIDFGVAKAVDRPLTERTLFTDFAQLIGTPLYMSPEQAQLSGLDIDTRSDVYSLGVLLYELLTGTTPFDSERFKRAGFDEMRRMIREDEPVRPSRRVSTLDARDASTLSREQGLEERSLTQALARDLDWIVMKCLEKDRNRRYETASALTLDIRRYLDDEPVQARPPSLGYRTRKFVHRHRGPVAAVSLITLALLFGLIGTTLGMIHARQASEEARQRLAQVERGTEILSSIFRDLQEAEHEGESLRVLLGRRIGEAAQQLEAEAVGDPLVMARLQDELGVSLAELGHADEAEELLTQASETRQRLLGANHLDTAATTHHLAMLYRDQAKYALAEKLYNEALAIRTARLGVDHPDTLTTLHYLARLQDAQGKYALAETLFKQVIALRSAKLGADHPDTLTSQHGLAVLYRTQKRHALAESLCKQVLSIRVAKLGADHLETITSKWHLALLSHSQEKYGEAERLYNEVLTVRTAKLGADHPTTLNVRHQLAMLYDAQGKHHLAESLYRELLAIRTAKLGPDHPTTLATQHSLAGRYQAEGNYALAETVFKDLLTRRTAKLGADHPDTLLSRHGLGVLYWAMKRHELSIPMFEECLALRKARLGADHIDTLGTQAALGVNYCDAGRFPEAIRLLEGIVHSGHVDPNFAWVGSHLLTAYARTGKTAEAAALAAEQVQTARQQFAADSSRLAAVLIAAGAALLDANAYSAAEPLLRESLDLTEEATIPSDAKARLAQALQQLVQHYDVSGRPEQAEKWRGELEAQTTLAKQSGAP